MTKLFWVIGSIFVSLILVAAAGYAAFLFCLSAPADFPVGQIVTIERGESLKQVAVQFEDKKIIRSDFVFRVAGWFLRTEKQIKAGEYFFENKMTALQIMRYISGSSYKNKTIRVLIPEGADLKDIASAFGQKDLFYFTGLPAVDCRESVCVDKRPDFSKQNYPFLESKPDYVSLEGYLFPDTYFVPSGITPEGVINMMLQNFEKKAMTPELKKAVGVSGYNLFQILTMASIIEKEAALESDRYLVSGILWKRLKNKMPLQVDAPFLYFLGKGSSQLTEEDLKTSSPYNTYKNPGLPLGPICNPGLSAIKAALFPKDSPFWYYLADKDGNTYYSITYDEHLAKKAKYLK